MNTCPICNRPTSSLHGQTPYWTCGFCGCWFQSPQPPKTYEADHEKDAHGNFTGHLMSDHDKEVNRSLAGALFSNWLKGVPGRTLDVGSKYPYLAHCLKALGCDAYGMDNLSIVPDYSRDLDVPMLLTDFEETAVEDILTGARFDLITLVHVFEHMYSPRKALRKLRSLLKDDGVLYIRMPDHDVTGFERDLTLGHYTIHPFFHCLSGVLELLVQEKDLFTLAETYPMPGAGQRDYLFRPLKAKPKVFAGLIVKNEERDLPRLLKSIEAVVDEVVIVDTGSTDKTIYVATHTIDKPVHTQVFMGASKYTKQDDEEGDWKLADFSKARNVFVAEIEKRGADFVLWMDADDELLTPQNLRRAFYWSQYQVFAVQIESGCSRWPQHRVWRTGLGIHYEGRCHEYPTIGGHSALELGDTIVRHDAAPGGGGEDSNVRNLRILSEEYAENPSPRCAFYLANTHKDGARYAEAVPFYVARIGMGPGFREEWLFAYLYKARCERAAGDLAASERTLLEAASHDHTWAEFWMELAYLAQQQGRQWHAIGYALQAARLAGVGSGDGADTSVPPSTLWREPNKYSDQPRRIISWSYEHLGDHAQALSWALKARESIGEPDEDWDLRVTRLEGLVAGQPVDLERKRSLGSRRITNGDDAKTIDMFSANVVSTTKKRLVAFHRPGAIGDVLMTLNLIPMFRAANPGVEIHYVCHPSIGSALGEIMRAAGVDVVEDSTVAHRRERFERWIDLIGYPLQENYPDKPMRKHLLYFFADEMGLSPGVLPALRLPRPKRLSSVSGERYATLQVQTGWSVYKNWPVERWAEVLAELPDIPVYQIGAHDDPRVLGANHKLMGSSLDTSVALVANAHLHLGLDSFANHLTNFRWQDDGKTSKVPGVILWGSTQVTGSGYPHNANISLGLSCQPCFREDPKISRMPRGACENPPGQSYEDPKHACMQGITVERVVNEIRRLWDRDPIEGCRGPSGSRR